MKNGGWWMVVAGLVVGVLMGAGCATAPVRVVPLSVMPDSPEFGTGQRVPMAPQ